ncbi:membrane-bound transcriptional regulator LytR [Listeria cornellensis FSL F6-0969]|uniref:Membrane-bound transcriptional regulator LytR n=2 Tax=Listeria cornellensis TaxID=1494961 RepID=W7C1T3_9LIST|nr:membrane-bound transcriptional regulator LytR [Listeria cornellensis FSL F6-0969]
MFQTKSTMDKIYEPVEGRTANPVKLDGGNPFSVLILGIDQREGDVGRSDTTIVATVNGTANKAQMLSIPRDTRTEIIGHDSTNKINAAYAYGGVKMAEDTVTNFLNGIPINYYIKINMEGLKDLVDAVGGVEVYNDMDISLKDKEFKKGNVTLNGTDALAYVRIRKTDARGDFGRQMRQQEVIQAVVEKVATTQTLWNFDEILSAVGKNMQTDLTMTDITRIAKNYISARNNVENMSVAGEGGKMDGIWYYNVSDAERQKLHDSLAKNLELK